MGQRPNNRVECTYVTTRKYIIGRLVYVLVLLLGLLVLYLLIPHDVWETIRTTYFARNVD